MCGIGGYLVNPDFKLTTKATEKFAQALQELHTFLDCRGGHAAGLVLNNGKQLKVNHIARTAFTMPDAAYVTDKPLWALCHTRLGTVGALTKANAHPHIVGSLIGAHNGSISNWALLKKNEGLKIKGDHTDTHVLWHLMQKKLREQTVENLVASAEQAIKQATGSAAVVLGCTWAPTKMLFFREKNPLYLLYIPELRSLWWASEAWMFYALGDAGIIPYHELESNLCSLPEGQLIGVDARDLGEVPQYFVRKPVSLARPKPLYTARVWPSSGYVTPTDCCVPSCKHKLGKRWRRFVFRSKQYNLCEDCFEWNEEILKLLGVHVSVVYKGH